MELSEERRYHRLLSSYGSKTLGGWTQFPICFFSQVFWNIPKRMRQCSRCFHLCQGSYVIIWNWNPSLLWHLFVITLFNEDEELGEAWIPFECCNLTMYDHPRAVYQQKWVVVGLAGVPMTPHIFQYRTDYTLSHINMTENRLVSEPSP